MKAWRPEDEFEAADFPSAKKKQPPPTTPDGPPLWAPEAEFERADFKPAPPPESRGKPAKPAPPRSNSAAASAPAAPPVAAPIAPAAERKVTAWQPGKLGAPGGTPPSARAPERAGAPAPEGPRAPRVVVPPVKPATPPAGPAAAVGASYANQLLRDLALARRESARHVLRRWYWEKPGQAPDALARIAGAERIFIVFSLIGASAAKAVLDTMTPSERAQMIAIFKAPRRKFAVNEIAAVRSAFMDAVREYDATL